MKYFIILLISLLFCSCFNNKKRMEYLICNNNVQYWNYEWPRDRSEYYGFTFCFNKDGTVTKYSYSKEKNVRRIFKDNHCNNPDKWSVTNDSILTIMNDSEKIIKITKDSIYATNIKTKEKVSYNRVKGNLHIVE